ncbi:DUF805 domain-containing protein [Teredinibacter turnerae]|uniref:DUF805 domain-containing protein n=1 Tax=Teredinibacter turnerae TaxID=2426 RepID=UPI0030D5EDBB
MNKEKSCESLDDAPLNYEELTLTKLYFSFSGRIGRLNFILGMITLLAFIILLLFSAAVLKLAENDFVYFLSMFYIPLIWCSLSLQAKRWHDRNKSAWWIVINFIPLGAVWAFIETCILAGTSGSNKYGVLSK